MSPHSDDDNDRLSDEGIASTALTPCYRPAKIFVCHQTKSGSVAEWLACWTHVQKARVQIAVATLRQTVHTHCASVHQAAKLVAALLRVAGVTAGLAESNGRLPLGL